MRGRNSNDDRDIGYFKTAGPVDDRRLNVRPSFFHFPGNLLELLLRHSGISFILQVERLLSFSKLPDRSDERIDGSCFRPCNCMDKRTDINRFFCYPAPLLPIKIPP